MPIQIPQLGSVVWIEIADPNGHQKIRPAVIVTPTSAIAPGQSVHLVAITTRVPEPMPEAYVLLPWDPQGKARSGLRRKCAAVAHWQVEIPIEDVQSIVGVLPPSVMSELLSKIARQLGSDE